VANLRGSELLILVLIVALLFGSKRLPDVARSVGRSMRIFKAETKALVDSDTASAEPPGQVTVAQQAAHIDAGQVLPAQDYAPQAQPPSQA
jgi:sec-independent protein translocase protein TatA